MHMLKMLNMYQVLICTYRVGDHSFLTFGWRVESHCIKLYDGNIHTYIHTYILTVESYGGNSFWEAWLWEVNLFLAKNY